MAYPILASKQEWYTQGGTITNKNTITEINIVDTYTVTGNETETWDASANKDGSINVYIEGTKLTMVGNGSGKISTNANASNMFEGMSALVTINGASILDLSNTTNINYMFYSCSRLTSLDISNWNVSNVTSMQSTFGYTGFTNLDISNWNVSNCIYMIDMFRGTKFSTIDLTKWNTKSLKNAYRIFFSSNITSIDLSTWNTSNLLNTSEMFGACGFLTFIDLSTWNTSNVTSMSHMFNQCTSLTSVNMSNWNTSKVTDMSYMFNQCTSLTTITGIEDWDVNKVTNMQAMFQNDSLLNVTITKDNIGWKVNNPSIGWALTDTSFMFWNCKNMNIDVSEWDVSKVTNFDHTFAHSYMAVDVSKWNTSSAINMYSMLHSVKSKREDRKFDVSNFNTSNVKYFGYMFKLLDADEIIGLENFDTSNGREFAQMFYQSKLKTLNLMNFDTTNARRDANEQASANNNSPLENCKEMFYGMNNLKSIILGPKFNFNGNGMNTSSTYKAILPTPALGYWYSNLVEKLTPAEIPDNRDNIVIYYSSSDGLSLFITYKTLEDIANAIREKLKTTDKILVKDFSTKINEITGESQLVTLTQAEYDTLVEDGAINEEFYYCIVEDSEPIKKIMHGLTTAYEWIDGLGGIVKSGIPPIILEGCNGEYLIDYKIYGNSVQEGTPTPDTPVEIQSVGDKTKNLFNEELLLTHPNAEKTEGGYQIKQYPATYGTTYTETNVLIEHIKAVLKPEVTYTFSRKFSGYTQNNDGVIAFRNSQNQNVFRVANGEGVRTNTFTLTQEQIDSITNMVIYGRPSTITLFEDIQLEEGTEVTEYEPYGYKIPITVNEDTYDIYLNEPLRKIGDYADYIDFKNNTVVRNIAEYTITGDEASWVDRDLSYTAYGIVFRNTNLVPLPTISTGIALCDHFPYGSIADTTAVFSKAVGNSDFQFKILDGQLGISKDEVASARLEKWLAWLKARYNEGNPVILNYILETPVETDIDLPTIKTHQGTNIIAVGTEIQPSNMQIQY